ncbi:hypothetical protein BS50DRAFT_470166, partial [Corynespora cassiicola Philippines]
RVLRSQTAEANSVSKPSAGAIANRSRRRRRGADPWTPKRKPAKGPRPPPKKPTHFTCRICIEELPVSDFVAYTTARNHARSEVPQGCVAHLTKAPRSKQDPVCKSCIGRNLMARYETLGWGPMQDGCLVKDCTTWWHMTTIIKFFPPGELWEQYNDDLFQSFLRINHLHECIDPKCSKQGLPDPHTPGYPQVECAGCKLRQCVRCRIPWHKGVTCAEYAASKVNEKMTQQDQAVLKLVQKADARRCPNCQFVIEKDGGCDSMFCEKCHKYFNWATAASAVPGAKSALPPAASEMEFNNGYGYGDPTVVCEMDALEAKANATTA